MLVGLIEKAGGNGYNKRKVAIQYEKELGWNY